jgi:hypothetical protein
MHTTYIGDASMDARNDGAAYDAALMKARTEPSTANYRAVDRERGRYYKDLWLDIDAGVYDQEMPTKPGCQAPGAPSMGDPSP